MEFCRDKQRSAGFHPLVNPDMGHKSKVLWQFKARILVWLIVMVFSIWLIDMGQYFELPFGSRITSRFSAGNKSSNMTIFNDLNSTATETYLNFDNTTKPSEGEDSGSENNFVPEKIGGINATPANIKTHSPIISVYPNTSLVDKETGNVIAKDEKSKEVQRQTVSPENSSSKKNVSAPKAGLKQPAVVVSISEMNDLLLQSRASSFSTVCARLSLRNWSEREI